MTARRSVLLAGLVCVLGVGGWCWAVRHRPSAAPSARPMRVAGAPRPDVLLVVYDARRRDDFSFGRFGNRRGDTPFLARFKDDALFFEEAVSPGCWTFPVHASIFSGRSICDLGVDYFSPSYSSFGGAFPTLAELLRGAGYQTIAYADHPYFYNQNRETSLVRGFEQFDVVNDFKDYASHTNVGTKDGAVVRRTALKGLADLSLHDVRDSIARFNRGELRFDLPKDADRDPGTGIYLAPLYPLFRASEYFQKRYGADFDAHVFPAGRTRPFFLFFNLHMVWRAFPDPGLYHRWLLQTVMMNAQGRGAALLPCPAGSDTFGCLEANYRALALPAAALGPPEVMPEMREPLKHIFDNRFYDACFQGIWEYLERRKLTDHLATMVTSDHGLSFGENGEVTFFHGGARPNEYITRVPLVLRLPPAFAAYGTGAQPQKVSLTDLFATVLDIAGVRSPKGAETPLSRSLLERIEHKDFEPVVFSESALRPAPYRDWTNVGGYGKAIYSRNMKLIYAPEVFRMFDVDASIDKRLSLPADRRQPPLVLLYDLAKDPYEKHNIATDQAEIVRKIAQLGLDWNCVARQGAAAAPKWDPAAIETLRSLGYVH